MESILTELRVAVRALRARPSFTLVAGLTFALGIGANTAIFSIVHGVLLKPLGYRDEARLVAVTTRHTGEGLLGRGNFLPDFWFWRENATRFDEMAFYGYRSMTLDAPGEARQLESVVVSANLFRLLGLEPALGRGFDPEDEVAGRGHVALVSDALWRRVFGGDPAAVGSTVRIDGNVVTVIGVMPPATDVPSRGAELWLPVGRLEGAGPNEFAREERDFRVVGRLASGATLAEALSEMAGLNRVLQESFPTTNAGWDVELVPVRELAIGNARAPILLAFAAVGLVLLIACTNIANLVLVRAAGQSREIAIRTALGAGRFRLLRQRVVESLLLTAGGGATGILLAAGLTEVLLRLDPGVLPRRESIQFDAGVLAFAIGLSLVTGIVFGLVPSLRRCERLTGALSQGGGQLGAGAAQSRARLLLVGSQIGLALALLVGAGALVKALADLRAVDPGFRAEGLYSAHVLLDDARYRELPPRRVYFRRLREAVAALPGVERAALTTTPPVPGMGIQIEVPFRGDEGPLVTEPGAPRAGFRVVSPGYFETARTPLLRGRDFDERDDETAPPVVIVNESLARRAFADGDAVGRPLAIVANDEAVVLEVVGVSADTRSAGLAAPPRPELFLPHPQMPFRGMAVVARTAIGPATFAETLRKTVLSLDPSQPVMNVDSLDNALSGTFALERFYSLLLGLFAAVAVALAATGIYGVFSYWTTQRRREMGLRAALGAGPGDIVRLVLSRGLAVTLAGLGMGLLASVALSRGLAASFQGVSGLDPFVIAGSVLGLGGVALLACYLPARAASRVAPTEALRAE